MYFTAIFGEAPERFGNQLQKSACYCLWISRVLLKPAVLGGQCWRCSAMLPVEQSDPADTGRAWGAWAGVLAAVDGGFGAPLPAEHVEGLKR